MHTHRSRASLTPSPNQIELTIASLGSLCQRRKPQSSCKPTSPRLGKIHNEPHRGTRRAVVIGTYSVVGGKGGLRATTGTSAHPDFEALLHPQPRWTPPLSYLTCHPSSSQSFCCAQRCTLLSSHAISAGYSMSFAHCRRALQSFVNRLLDRTPLQDGEPGITVEEGSREQAWRN